MEKFKLSKTFLDQYSGKQPKWGPLGYVTYKRTYSRSIKEEKRTEEYSETLERVINGVYSLQKIHAKNLRLPWNEQKSQRSAQKMFELMWDFKFTPAGRGFWIMGTDFMYERGSAALNNCAFVSTNEISTNFSAPFCFMMDMLMLGVGVSGDTKGADTVKITSPRIAEPDDLFVVEDTREGWVSALEMSLNAFIGKGRLQDLDVSKVRPEGTPIKGFGGIASGPDPLVDAIIEIKKLLDPKNNGGEDYKIRSDQIVDIFNLIGKCVVAGNVRRSAELMLGDPDDEVFRKLKQDKEKLMSHRWASNNSIIAKIGMDYSDYALDTSVNGEPGYFWLDNSQKYGRLIDPPNWKDRRALGTNPCSEQTLESFELCNLVETYPSNHESLEDWITTLKFAYLYAKSVTLLLTHDERTNAVMGRNRRIGLSASGIIDAFNKFGRRETLIAMDKGYKYVKELDEMYSDWLCIPRSIKMTTVKPSGTVSLLAGVSPGIHYPHSEYYIRRIRMMQNSPLIPILKKARFNIEDDKYSPNTAVISFPMKETYFKKGKNDVSMWEQVKNAVDLQYYWSDNQVSITVTVKEEEQSDIKTVLESFEDSLKSISFLPLTEHGYEQPPYEEITEVEYNKLNSKIKPLNYEKLNGNGAVHDHDEKFCSNDSCEIKIPAEE
jgi:adenosylcobalamin-dependent ribonucleoside-triphosphate reductase